MLVRFWNYEKHYKIKNFDIISRLPNWIHHKRNIHIQHWHKSLTSLWHRVIQYKARLLLYDCMLPSDGPLCQLFYQDRWHSGDSLEHQVASSRVDFFHRLDKSQRDQLDVLFHTLFECKNNFLKKISKKVICSTSYLAMLINNLPKFNTVSPASECMTSTNKASEGSKRTNVGISSNKGAAGSRPDILPIFSLVNSWIFSPAYPAICDPKECPIIWKSSIEAPRWVWKKQEKNSKGLKTKN